MTIEIMIGIILIILFTPILIIAGFGLIVCWNSLKLINKLNELDEMKLQLIVEKHKLFNKQMMEELKEWKKQDKEIKKNLNNLEKELKRLQDAKK